MEELQGRIQHQAARRARKRRNRPAAPEGEEGLEVTGRETALPRLKKTEYIKENSNGTHQRYLRPHHRQDRR